jgi:hypothetical protein
MNFKNACLVRRVRHSTRSARPKTAGASVSSVLQSDAGRNEIVVCLSNSSELTGGRMESERQQSWSALKRRHLKTWVVVNKGLHQNRSSYFIRISQVLLHMDG